MSGDLTVTGRLVDASNATLYCTVRLGDTEAACVYKPVAGERPLWDFPDGTLAGREVAAYQVSAAAGWDIVPPTVYRDGPFGPGMCQLWIDLDPEVDLIELARSDRDPALRAMAVFDAVITTRTARSAICSRRRAAGCTAAITVSASAWSTSSAPSSGSGAANRCRPPISGRSSG